MSFINNEEDYKNIIKDKHLIIILEDYCSFSNYFKEKINDINFEKIYFVNKHKNKDLFDKLIFNTTPTIILNKKIIFPANIIDLNKIIEHNQ